MKLRGRLFNALRTRLLLMAALRAPDFIIGGAHRPYMLRWWLTPWSGLNRNIPDDKKTLWQAFLSKLPAVYLHQILRSDDDRALHDHPWANISIVLLGSYVEHTIAAGGIQSRARRLQGDVVIRRAKAAHRLEIDEGYCWSLFITFARVRHWGFHCPKGWVHWRAFTDPKDAGAVGRGCE
jgi:hypothetical protein